MRALRQQFPWRLVDSQRCMVHAAKRKLIAQQAGGRRHTEHARSCAALQGGSRLLLADVEYFLQSMGLRLLVLEQQLVPGTLGCTVGACSACMLRMFVACRQASSCQVGPFWRGSCRSCRRKSAVVSSRVRNATQSQQLYFCVGLVAQWRQDSLVSSRSQDATC